MPKIPAGAKVTSLAETAAQGRRTGFLGRVSDAVRYAIRGISPDSWMSPNQPVAPTAQEQAYGRRYDYPIGVNLIYTPRAGEATSFQQLRALADNCDLVRIAIETRKDQLVGLAWDIAPIEESMEKDARCAALQTMLARPDGTTGWQTWLRQVIEEVLVTDAVAILPRLRIDGTIAHLELIDGATIKPLLDDTGRAPVPPSPAYQQVIKGLPAVDYRADELVYMPRNLRVHKVYGFCYDAETEILTQRRGWVKFAALHDADFVATRSGAGAFEWQLPSRIVREQWHGDMYHFTSRSMDLLVTPEHKMLVTGIPRGVCGTRRGPEAVVTAQQLAEHGNHEVKVPVTSTWDGSELGEQVFADECLPVRRVERVLADGTIQTFNRRKTPAQTVRLNGDDFCALMGAYVAEGNIRHQGGIEVAQLEKSKGYGIYKALFDRIGGSYSGRAFVLPRRAITAYFRQFGHAHEKFVPEIIMDATPRQLRIFWDHYIAGDGCYEARRNVSGRGTHPSRGESATTVSRRLADQLVEIAQKLGMSASVQTRPGARAAIVGNLCKTRESYRIRCRYSRAMSASATKTHYAGNIYCVTVPNGIVYVRRNGKPAWCGNSPVEQIIMTVNIAIRRGLSQLEYYTAGSVPEALASVPKDWSPQQIEQFQGYWDSVIEGDQAQKRKMRFVPGDTKAQMLREAPLKDEFDEWLARVVTYAFSLPPTQFIKTVARATNDQLQEAALEQGLAPLMAWIKDLMDGLIQRTLGFSDLEFRWAEQEALDPQSQAIIFDTYLKLGVYTLNEVRQRLGSEPVDGGNDPLIYTATGAVLLKDIITPPAPPPMPAAFLAPDGTAAPSPGAPPHNHSAPKDAEEAQKLAKADTSPLTAPMQTIADAFEQAFDVLRKEVAKGPVTKASSATGDGNHAADDATWGGFIDELDTSALSLAWDDYTQTLFAVATNGARAQITQVIHDGELSAEDAKAAIQQPVVALTPEQIAAGEVPSRAPVDLLDYRDPDAVTWAQDHAAELLTKDGTGGELSDATRNMLRRALAKAIEDKANDQEIAAMLQDNYAFSRARAELIARTEVRNATGHGRLAGAQRVGMTFKDWLLSGDPNVCPLCVGNAAQGYIPINEPFSGGVMAPLQHPACRCTATYTRHPNTH